ncbi:hypothetical protein ACNVED_05570 [Legionella sp. D16C41]|uniref:hypothetical protein n=1 Tax=Legionella sp. D16C41 TaxID=3402688 RepID=UPI003AF50B75
MGKFSSGMKKYGKQLKAEFSFDREKTKQIKQENKLTHAEKLALTPVAMVVDPLVLIPVGIGLTVVGLIALPAGLVSKILFGKGGTVAAVGGGLVVGGVVVTGVGAVSPVIDVASIPYNSYKAIKHRHHNRHHKDKVVPINHVEEIAENKSYVIIRENLSNGQNLASHQAEPLPPLHTTQLFPEANNVQVQEEVSAMQNVVNL